MRVCGRAHDSGRPIDATLYRVTLISAARSVPNNSKVPENDDRRAEAIAEQATRPTMHFVESRMPPHVALQSRQRVPDCRADGDGFGQAVD